MDAASIPNHHRKIRGRNSKRDRGGERTRDRRDTVSRRGYLPIQVRRAAALRRPSAFKCAEMGAVSELMHRHVLRFEDEDVLLWLTREISLSFVSSLPARVCGEQETVSQIRYRYFRYLARQSICLLVVSFGFLFYAYFLQWFCTNVSATCR